MRTTRPSLTRRSMLQAAAAATCAVPAWSAPEPVSLFDGKTLDGWIQIENSAASLATGGITDPVAFIARLAKGTDAVSSYLRTRLQGSASAGLAADSASDPNAKAIISALAKDLNTVISGPSIYEKARFDGVTLRPETERLLQQNPSGAQQRTRLNKLL